MRKFLLGVLAGLVVVSLAGCAERAPGAVDAKTKIEHGNGNLVEIGNGLWYDSTTKVVYWWNGELRSTDWSTTPTPYYAPNGLPYRYNPEKQTFEEIDIHGEV